MSADPSDVIDTENPIDSGETDAPLEPHPLEVEVTRLQAELAERDRRLDEVLRAYSAAKNEQTEFRARLNREREQLITVEKGKVAMAFLEAADELDRALKAAVDDTSALAQGVRLSRESMSRKMASLGIEPLSLVGRPFDPNTSEAVDLAAVDDPSRDGMVIEEVTRGYALQGKLLRAALVRVGKWVATADPGVSE